MSNDKHNIKDKKCLACRSDMPSLDHDTIGIYLAQLKNPWEVLADKKIKLVFKFTDFKESMRFANQAAELAEKEGHHPNMEIDFKQVTIILWTHKIDGLSENDFIMASKIENIKI